MNWPTMTVMLWVHFMGGRGGMVFIATQRCPELPWKDSETYSNEIMQTILLGVGGWEISLLQGTGLCSEIFLCDSSCL